MGFMEWSPEFEIGVPAMDEQHKKWLDILNRFYNHLSDTDMSVNLKALINEVLDYTRYHFSEEEKLMAKIGYTKIEEQKRMHKDITEKISDFKAKIDGGKQVLSIAVTGELKSWFKEHIMVEDRKYADVFRAAR